MDNDAGGTLRAATRALSLLGVAILAALTIGVASAAATVYSGSTSYAAPAGTPSLNGPTPDPAQTQEYLHTLSTTYDDQSGTVTIQFSLYDPATWGADLSEGDGGSGTGGNPLFTPVEFSLGYLGDPEHPATIPGAETARGVFCDPNEIPGVEAPDLGGPVLSGSIQSVTDDDGNFAGTDAITVTLHGYTGSVSAPVSFDGTTFTATIQSPAFAHHVWDCLVLNQATVLPIDPPAPRPSLPTLLNPWGQTFSRRPQQIGLSGDATSFLAGARQQGSQTRRNYPHWAGRINWMTWMMTQAVGSGGNWLDNCRPDCASGHYYVYRAQLKAYDPQNGHFARLSERLYYHHEWRTYTYKLVHSGSGWYW